MTPTWRMQREILEQSTKFSQRLDAWMTEARPLREQILRRDQLVVLGRGSSRHAGIYAAYLYGLATGRHAVEFRLWMTTRKVPRVDWSNTAVLALSASGRSTDVARASKWLAERGSFVVGVTNADDDQCALGEASSALFHLGVGGERAVPATKSFNAQLLACAALLGFELEAALPEVVASFQLMEEGTVPQRLADLVQEADSLAWIARGPSLAAACDAALKCREAARLESTGWSAAEFQHGHIGSFGSRDRAILLCDANQPAGSFSSVAKGLLNRRTPFAVVGLDFYRDNGGAAAPMLPIKLPPQRWARTPVFAYLSQQVALELAIRKDLNPDDPVGLQKVTETQ